MRRLVLVLALALAGCAGAEPPSPEAVQLVHTFPANYKAELMAYLHTFLNDPTGVRNAYVSEPTLRRIQGIERYFICLRFDAKRASGGYRGSRDYLASYLGGKLEQFVELRPGAEQCRSATYQAFPELEHMAGR